MCIVIISDVTTLSEVGQTNLVLLAAPSACPCLLDAISQ